MMAAWTEEEDSILLSSHADGLSDRAIAGLLDRSETACRKRRQRLGATEPMNLVDRARKLAEAEARWGRKLETWRHFGRWWIGKKGEFTFGVGETEAIQMAIDSE